MAVPACSSPDAGVRYPYPDAVTPTLLANWRFEDYVSCELVGFIIANASGEGGLEEVDGCPYIPQNSTVNLTADSSPYLFKAYRELGRYYARQLGWFFGDSDSKRMVDEALRRSAFKVPLRTRSSIHWSAKLYYKAVEKPAPGRLPLLGLALLRIGAAMRWHLCAAR